MTGLTNQGYSCYVNCVLQSLLNTPKFVFLYIMKALRPYINKNNSRGTKGALSGCLSAVADCFWSTNFKSVNTKAFLVRTILCESELKYCLIILANVLQRGQQGL